MKKRLLSAILTIIILFAAMPLSSSAVEGDYTQDGLIELACQIYPEYADKIRYQTINTAINARSSDVSLVYSDSRKVSDNETLLYSEYSNGIILLTLYDFDDNDFKEDVDPIDIATGAGATAYTSNITATCTNISGSFHVDNFRYTLISSAYDRIDSLGNYYAYEKPGNGIENDCYFRANSTNPSVQMNETATKNAYAIFSLQFRFSPYPDDVFTSELSITVGDNNIIVEHNKT